MPNIQKRPYKLDAGWETSKYFDAGSSPGTRQAQLPNRPAHGCRLAGETPGMMRSPGRLPVCIPSGLVCYVRTGEGRRGLLADEVQQRLLAPFRSNPFLQSSTHPCAIGFASGFLPRDAATAMPVPSRYEPDFVNVDASQPGRLEQRTEHRGPFAHHWLELETA